MSAPHPATSPGTTAKVPPGDPVDRARRGAVAAALRVGGDPRFMGRTGRTTRVSDTVETCGDRAFVYSCDIPGHEPDWTARSCDHRLCPTCQPRLSGRRKQTAFAAVNKAISEGGDGQLAHLVFTIPNQDKLGRSDLRELAKKVTRWFRRVRVEANVSGVYRNLEVTWKGDSGWHPHVHSFAMLKGPRTRAKARHGHWDWGDMQRQLIMEWHELTGCVRTCAQKIASFAEKSGHLTLDQHDEWVGAGGGCTRGGSAWLGDIYNCRDLRSGKDCDVWKDAHQVSKYIAKGIWSWPDDQVDEGVPFDFSDLGINVGAKQLAALAYAVKGVRLSCGMGFFFGVKHQEDKHEGMICQTCLDLNLAHPTGPRFPQTMHNRGSPSFIKWQAEEEGDEVAAILLASLAIFCPELWPEAPAPPSR